MENYLYDVSDTVTYQDSRVTGEVEAHYDARILRVDFVEPKCKISVLMEKTLCWDTDVVPSFLLDQPCDFRYEIIIFKIVLNFYHVDIMWDILISQPIFFSFTCSFLCGV